MSRAVATSAFVGTHPVQRQSPPSFSRSISATLRPSRAQPDAVTSPAVPPPMTMMSKSSDIDRDFPRPRAVELDEVHPLPGAEDELPAAVRPGERGADQ